MLTKALGKSKTDEFCAENSQTLLHAKTVDKNPEEVKELTKVKFAVETMETNDETIKNKLKDSSWSQLRCWRQICLPKRKRPFADYWLKSDGQ